jgi:transposase
MPSVTGAESGARVLSGLPIFPGAVASRVFPPTVVTTVKAVACDRAGARARGQVYFSIRDLAARVREVLALTALAPSTVWEILQQDALKPWQYRSWIFPRDPEFAARAGVVLDLYGRIYQGQPLGAGDFIFSGDEKPGLLLRSRCHPTVPPAPGHTGLQEFEYRRHGVAVLLSLMDVGNGRVFHQTVPQNGIAPFQALLRQVVEQEPYRHARRLFFVVDNGGSHGKRFQSRLDEAFPRPEYPEMIAVHLPKHASWLNQIELFFSLVGRKALRRFECRTQEAMAEHLERFIATHNEAPRPFNWRFTKDDLAKRMERWPDPTCN